MPILYEKGRTLDIHITEDGVSSIVSLTAVHGANITKELARANMLIKMLADTGRLRSPDQFRNEGKGFWAIKANHVRVYGWFEPGGCFVISHVIYKKENKLAQADTNRFATNQKKYRS